MNCAPLDGRARFKLGSTRLLPEKNEANYFVQAICDPERIVPAGRKWFLDSPIYLTHHEAATKKMDFPSHQYQFNQAYSTEREADQFAVRMAQTWIDTH